ncbi:MAG: PilT/PilU family type 4a pilus ATPase [Patescibacteria group bacterium]|jgi:twitching motility protein PilT
MALESSSLLFTLFQEAAAQKASDIHLAVGQPPIFRIHGDLGIASNHEALTFDAIQSEIVRLVTPAQLDAFKSGHDVDVSYELPSKERFRVNLYREKGRPALAARFIPSIIPTMDELDAPEAALAFVNLTQGLVMVTGPTGAGKTTLLASMLEHMNQNRVEHIMTFEDPIEFVYEPKKSLISQRELGTDFLTFADGLKHVFRQDPDIVMVGEMRDPETIALALTLAETGHLVLATLHTNGAAQTVERIIDNFPASQQQQIRQQLSLSLRGVISQLLVPSVKGELVAVHEVLTNTNAVANVIRDGRTEQLPNIIFTSTGDHMVDLDQELHWLVEQNMITAETAKIYAHQPKNF